MGLGFSSAVASVGVGCVVSVDAARDGVEGSDSCGGEGSGETAASSTGVGGGGGGETAGSVGSSIAGVGSATGIVGIVGGIGSGGIMAFGLAE